MQQKISIFAIIGEKEKRFFLKKKKQAGD